MLSLSMVFALPSLSGTSIVPLVAPARSLAAVTGETSAPLALAFGAGVLAVFNPCGFALLPAFISYTAGGQSHSSTGPRANEHEHEEVPAAARLLQGFGLGLPLTAGFLLVFLVAGGALAAAGRVLAQIFPWLGLLVGLALVVLGVRLLVPGVAVELPLLARFVAVISRARGQRPSAATAAGGGVEASRSDTSERSAAPQHPLRAAWGFGIGYGLSSLGCTLPVFLLVVGSAIAAGGLAQAVLLFAAYGAGMAVVLLGVALAATTLGDVLRHSVLPLLRWVQPLSALLILAAGLYIVVYQLHAGFLIH